MKQLKTLLAGILLLSAGLAQAESGIALKADTLRAEPFADAKVTGKMARNDKLEILGQKGAWLKVKTPKFSGWVRLLAVKRATTAKSNTAAGVLGIASGRTGTGQVVSTTGVRGLSEEELRSAKFNEDEVKTLENYAVSTDQAQAFANAGDLKARKLDYLPKPSNQGSQP